MIDVSVKYLLTTEFLGNLGSVEYLFNNNARSLLFPTLITQGTVLLNTKSFYD